MWSQPGGEIGTSDTPIATPPVIITGLAPRTTYTFSVTAYTITGPGTPPQVQTSTADIREHFSVYIHKAEHIRVPLVDIKYIHPTIQDNIIAKI